MSLIEGSQPRFDDLRRKLLLSLAINGLLPLLAYGLLRLVGIEDLMALLVAAAIPAVRTLALWLWRRRVDWFGLQALVGFGLAAAGSLLLGGNPLLLEVHGQLLTGVIGLVLLFSAAIGKPLLLSLSQALLGNNNNPELAGRLADNPARHKVMTVVTLLVGLAFLANAVVHVVLALTLPVDTFMGVSRVINWALIGGAVIVVGWLRRRGVGLGRPAGENQ